MKYYSIIKAKQIIISRKPIKGSINYMHATIEAKDMLEAFDKIQSMIPEPVTLASLCIH